MTPARALNHVGMTVPDIDRAIDWYSAVLGFQLIYRRTLEHQPAVPEVEGDFRSEICPSPSGAHARR